MQSKFIRKISISMLVCFILSLTALTSSTAFAEDNDVEALQALVTAAKVIKKEEEKVQGAFHKISSLVTPGDRGTYVIGVGMINTLFLIYDVTTLEYDIMISRFADHAKKIKGESYVRSEQILFDDISLYELLIDLRAVLMGYAHISCKKDGKSGSSVEMKTCMEDVNRELLKRHDVEASIVALADRNRNEPFKDVFSLLFKKADGLSFGENRWYRAAISRKDIDAYLETDSDGRNEFEDLLREDDGPGDRIVEYIRNHTLQDSPLKVLANRYWTSDDD